MTTNHIVTPEMTPDTYMSTHILKLNTVLKKIQHTIVSGEKLIILL